MYQRGDIVLVPFPFTDLSTTKRRPALIVSNELVNATGDVIIVMITSKDKNDSLQIEIRGKDISTDFPKKSFVRCHRIVSIDSNLISTVISKANNDLLKRVEEKIHLFITETENPVFAAHIAE